MATVTTDDLSLNSSIHHSSHHIECEEEEEDASEEVSKNGSSESGTMAERESKAVGRFRWLFLGAILVAAAAACTLIFIQTRKGEEMEFESQFHGVAEQVTTAFERIASDKIGALGALRVASIGDAVDKNATWPFVTLSSFEKRAASTLRLSGSIYVGISPVVSGSNREEWERYVASAGPKWMSESLRYQNQVGTEIFGNYTQYFNDTTTSNPITEFSITKGKIRDEGPGPHAPIWQSSPLITFYVNVDLMSLPVMGKEYLASVEAGSAVIGSFMTPVPGGPKGDDVLISYYGGFLSTAAGERVKYAGDPISHVYLPIFGSFEEDDRTTVASMMAIIQWSSYFENLLSSSTSDVVIVLENPCDGSFTYTIKGKEVEYNGPGDWHDPKLEYLERKVSYGNMQTIYDGTENGIPFLSSYCPITLRVYPTEKYHEQYNSSTPWYMALIVALLFVFTFAIFTCYDRLVEVRQALILTKAMQSGAVVSSLFPKTVAERVMQQQQTKGSAEFASNGKDASLISRSVHDDQPIADLFPNASVLFADISGFTAWSSTREPVQVFILLQNVYEAFDQAATRRKVFKVETIGDCYVAVTGVPYAQENHALIMVRFAKECQHMLADVTSDLALRLGPGTDELAMRMGIHSGPVTAGVLRGDRARFQLFGDTVNTAARMESTGVKNMIQLSSDTANCLIKAGKQKWVIPREDRVEAKGKGLLVTYWLNVGTNNSMNASHLNQQNAQQLKVNEENNVEIETRQKQLVDWTCGILQTHIQKVVDARLRSNRSSAAPSVQPLYDLDGSGVPVCAIAEAIVLPEFSDSQSTNCSHDVTSISLSDDVTSQLHHYVATIANCYRDNPFHNFEHACHVTMSVSKLLKRVVNPTSENPGSGRVHDQDWAHRVYDCSYGINSDPITMLALVLSAVIHDVDHRGISNAQLIKEDPALAEIYGNNSVAEQNSVDMAWKLLMSEPYKALRDCIFDTHDELIRFRQVLVNVVLATDIFDPDLNAMRARRWDGAFTAVDFSLSSSMVWDPEHSRNLRATIVLEHLMQASDVSHTMQHWNVYRKWNALLFREMYAAFRSGRMETDPSALWYEGELSFFDNYVIPLTHKLRQCNAFGVSCDEYLNYAERNRAIWEARGKEIVSEMIAELDFPLGVEL